MNSVLIRFPAEQIAIHFIKPQITVLICGSLSLTGLLKCDSLILIEFLGMAVSMTLIVKVENGKH